MSEQVKNRRPSSCTKGSVSSALPLSFSAFRPQSRVRSCYSLTNSDRYSISSSSQDFSAQSELSDVSERSRKGARSVEIQRDEFVSEKTPADLSKSPQQNSSADYRSDFSLFVGHTKTAVGLLFLMIYRLCLKAMLKIQSLFLDLIGHLFFGANKLKSSGTRENRGMSPKLSQLNIENKKQEVDRSKSLSKSKSIDEFITREKSLEIHSWQSRVGRERTKRVGIPRFHRIELNSHKSDFVSSGKNRGFEGHLRLQNSSTLTLSNDDQNYHRKKPENFQVFQNKSLKSFLNNIKIEPCSSRRKDLIEKISLRNFELCSSKFLKKNLKKKMNSHEGSPLVGLFRQQMLVHGL